MSKITEKIAKLLALAESPYEEEAKAALLQARRLMAEHIVYLLRFPYVRQDHEELT